MAAEVGPHSHNVTCTRLPLVEGRHIFVRVRWLKASFSVTALDCPQAWSCHVTTEEVEDRASKWDISVEDYLCMSRLHLSSPQKDSTYYLLAIRDDSMRFSWTVNDKKNAVMLKVNLTLSQESNTIAVIPGFLNTLMDATQELKEMEASRRAEKTKKARRMAMRFRCGERIAVKKQAPTREVIHGGFDRLYLEEQVQKAVRNFSFSSLSYEPPSSLDSPTHGLRDERALGPVTFQTSHLEPQVTPTPETPRSTLKSAQTAPPMKSPNSAVFNPVRHLSEKEVLPVRNNPGRSLQQSAYSSEKYPPTDCLAQPLRGLHATFCFDSPDLAASNARGAHGQQLKPVRSECEAGSYGSSRGLAVGAEVHGLRALEQRGHCIQLPLADDYILVVNTLGSSSHLKIPVNEDVADGALDRGGSQATCSEAAVARSSCEHGMPWAQLHTSGRPSTVDTAPISRPGPPVGAAVMKGCLQKTLPCDKGIISLETKKMGVQNSGAAVGGKGGDASTSAGAGSKSSGLPGVTGHGSSSGQAGVIVLSDSDEEDCYNNPHRGGIKDDGALKIERAVEGLSPQPEENEMAFTSGPQEKTVTQIIQEANNLKSMTMTGGSRRDLAGSFSTQGKKKLKNGNVDSIKVKEEPSRWRLEREDGSRPSSLGKRKERTDINPETTVWTDIHLEDKAAKRNSSWFEEQSYPQRVSLQRNQRELDAQVCVAGGITNVAVAQREEDDKRKPIHTNVDSCKEKLPSSPIYETRAQWSTWIKEAKTEVASWETPTENRDFRNGGSSHEEQQRTESPTNIGPVNIFKHLDTPPSLKKLERKFDMFDIPKVKPEHLPQTEETQTPGPSSGNGRSNREGLDRLNRRPGERPEPSYTWETDTMKKQSVVEDVPVEIVKSERREFVGGDENMGENESREEHVFHSGESSEEGGMRRVGKTVAKVLEAVAHPERLKPRSQKEKERSVRPPAKEVNGQQKPPGRRRPGRPPGKSRCKSRSIQTPPRSQGRSVGGPTLRHTLSRAPSPSADSIDEEIPVGVEEDQELQSPVPDSDYYCFDNDRTEANIKPNQVWALYDGHDQMPRTWVRIKKVGMHKSKLEVTATWLEPINSLKKDLYHRKISCGEFKEIQGGPNSIRTLRCFSHEMQFLQISETVVQIYPRVGEVWALHRNKARIHDSSEKAKQQPKAGVGSDSFRLVVILSDCKKDQAPQILVLKKRTGYRTLWEPGYEKGPLPNDCMELFSHRVPAYKLTAKECPELEGLECWDIDAAALPLCQSFVT